MSIDDFGEQLKNCKVNILMICGKSSVAICERLSEWSKDWPYPPNFIALQSDRYSINSEPFTRYEDSPFREGERAWEYLCCELNELTLDMVTISIVNHITGQLSRKKCTFTQSDLDDLISRSQKFVYRVIEGRFDCAKQVFSAISINLLDRLRSFSPSVSSCCMRV